MDKLVLAKLKVERAEKNLEISRRYFIPQRIFFALFIICFVLYWGMKLGLDKESREAWGAALFFLGCQLGTLFLSILRIDLNNRRFKKKCESLLEHEY